MPVRLVVIIAIIVLTWITLIKWWISALIITLLILSALTSLDIQIFNSIWIFSSRTISTYWSFELLSNSHTFIYFILVLFLQIFINIDSHLPHWYIFNLRILGGAIVRSIDKTIWFIECVLFRFCYSQFFSTMRFLHLFYMLVIQTTNHGIWTGFLVLLSNFFASYLLSHSHTTLRFIWNNFFRRSFNISWSGNFTILLLDIGSKNLIGGFLIIHHPIWFPRTLLWSRWGVSL